jgi:hypothetical protein
VGERHPGAVPDEPGAPDQDTDGDGLADTLVVADGTDLVLRTDLDADGFVDQEVRIGPDGVPREVELPGAADPVLDGLLGGVELGW